MEDELLRRSKELVSKALRLSREGFLFYRLKDLLIIEVNDAFTEIFGFTRDELIGKTITELKISGTETSALDFAELLKKEKTLRGIERAFRNKAGETRIGKMSAELLEINGELYGFVNGRDITEEKAAETEKNRLLEILESASDFIGIADAEGKIIYNNRAVREFMGFSSNQSVTDFHVANYHPEWVKRLFEEDVMPALMRDGRWEGETAILNPRTGEETPLSQVIIAHKNEKGEIKFISTFGRDISKVKEIGESLRATKEFLFNLINNAPSPIYTVFEENRLGLVNEAFAEPFGTPPEKLNGALLEELFSAEECEQFRSNNRRVMETQKPLSVVEWSQSAGKIRFYETIKFPMRDSKGEITGIGGISHDVTDVLQAQKAVEQSEAQFRAVFENSLDGMLIADDEGRYLNANEAVCQLLKTSKDKIINRTIADFGDFAPDADFKSRWRKFLEKGEESGIVTVRASDGERVEVEYAARANFLPGRHLSVLRDVTARKRAEAALQKSEERFRALIENSYDIISIHDADGRMIYQSPSITAVLGYEQNELIGEPLNDYLHPDDAANVARVVEKMKSQPNVPQTVEARFKHKEGWWCVFECTGVNLLENPAVGGIVFNARDITKRREAEDRLRRSETRFRNIVESINEGLIITDFEDKVIYANRRLTEMTGFTLEEMAGKPAYTFLLPRENWDEMLTKNERRRNGIVERYENETLRKDGSRFWTEANAVPFCNDEGEIIGTIGIIRDISKRKRTEQELAERGRLLSVSQQIAHIGSWEWNLKTDEIYWTDEAFRILGLEPQSLAVDLQVFDKYLHRDDKQLIADNIAQMIAEKKPTALEYRVVRSDGKTRVLSSIREVVLDEAGEVVKIVGTEQDITETRLLEEQLRQSQKLEAVGQLAGGIAHDFNNMLTAINGYTDLILKRLDEKDSNRAYIEEIKKAGTRAAELTAQLLAYSRKQILQPKVINVNTVIKDTASMLQRVIGENITLITILAADLANIAADESQVTQILMNLVVNARDAMPRGGNLVIETENVFLDENYAALRVGVKPGKYVLLAVTDTGTGIDEETQKRIFEPFFTTKEVGKGTGMGLATVYGIVKQSGGNIWVYSEPGKGTTFKIYLPQIEAEVDLLTGKKQPLGETKGTETILLVEDEDIVRGVARQILEESGYTVVEATDGEEAIKICEQRNYAFDLILVDVVMPKMSGRETADYLLEKNPSLKVLFMSGYTNDAIVHHGVLDEGTAFIQKPFTIEDLINKVREVLSSPS